MLTANVYITNTYEGLTIKSPSGRSITFNKKHITDLTLWDITFIATLAQRAGNYIIPVSAMQLKQV
jgi:hypothetical protein